MELIQLPKPMRNRGFKGWPAVYRVGEDEEPPPPGISYIIAEKVDFPLVFRLMIPTLQKQHPYFDLFKIYQDLTGIEWSAPRVFQTVVPTGSGIGHSYDESSHGTIEVDLETLASEDCTYVDMDMLAELHMMPTFMTDIRDAIAVNVTNNYTWTDGYDKKRGLCTGFMTEAPRAKQLVILDVSGSIPDGISSGMLTLIKTITDITHADLIITSGISEFYPNEKVRDLDIHDIRRRFDYNNESQMFRQILAEHDMDYDIVITFGDSDNPGSFGGNGRPVELGQKIHTRHWYSFFCMKHDTYGNHWEEGCGYGRWVKENNPHVNIVHNTDWAKFFKDRVTW